MKKSSKTAISTDSHVGSRVRMRRKMLGLSQTVLAKKLGVTFQQLQKYENGKNRISASRLHAIAHALETPIAFFFEPHAPAVANGDAGLAEVNTFVTSTDGIVLMRSFQNIGRSTLRRCIVDLVEQIAQARSAR